MNVSLAGFGDHLIRPGSGRSMILLLSGLVQACKLAFGVASEDERLRNGSW